MKKRILMSVLALSVCLFGNIANAATPDVNSGATVTISDHNSVVWNAENIVPIFSNTVFYPGYKDDYWFTVKNTNTRSIEYQMVFDLKDNSGVPLDIKVSRDNKVIFDHRTENHETEETVESEVLNLPAGASFSYHFELAWDETSLTDEEDTLHGLEAMSQDKTTSVNFWFEKPEIEGGGTTTHSGTLPSTGTTPHSGTAPSTGATPNNKPVNGLTKTSDGNTEAIGQALPSMLGKIAQSLPDTLGKFGEKNQVLASFLCGGVTLIIALILWKRRKADDEN